MNDIVDRHRNDSGITPINKISLEALVRRAQEWIEDLFDDVYDLLQIIIEVTVTLGSTAIALASAPLLSAIYTLECALYTIFRFIRSLGVTFGLFYPEPDEVNDDYCTIKYEPYSASSALSIGIRQVIDSVVGLNTLNSLGVSTSYPHRPIPKLVALAIVSSSYINSFSIPQTIWPLGDAELKATESGPYKRGQKPDVFMTDALRNDELFEQWLNSASPKETDRLNSLTFDEGRQLGNAVDFSTTMITDPTKIRNFNLDSDRGYAYKTWRPQTTSSADNPLHTWDQQPADIVYLP